MNPTVLVAEPDECTQERIAWCLRLRGYRVLAARDVVDALNKLICGSVDLMILDMDLPGPGGAAVLRYVAHDPDLARTRILAIGATMQPVNAPLLLKPFTDDELVDTVENMLAPVRRKAPSPPVFAADHRRNNEDDGHAA